MKRTLSLPAFVLLCAPFTAYAGSISGQVKNAANGQPLAGVQVKASHLGCGPGMCFPYDAVATTTDAQGRYTLSGLLSEGYSVYTSTQQFADVDQTGAYCAYPFNCERSSTMLDVGPATSLTNVDFTLHPGATISGVVYDGQTALPVAGASVHVVLVRPYSAYSDRSATSGADGSYSIDGLPEGGYIIIANGAGSLLPQYYPGSDCDNWLVDCDDTTAPRVTLQQSEHLAGRDFHLNHGATISGDIVDAVTGAHVPIAARVIKAADLSAAVSATSTSTGYTIGPLVPTAVVLKFDWWPNDYVTQTYPDAPCPAAGCDLAHAVTLNLAAGQSITGADAHLQPKRIIRGGVHQAGSGAPVAGVQVSAGDLSTGNDAVYWGFHRISTAVTAADGSFVITGFYDHDNLVVRTTDQSGTWIDGAANGVTCDIHNRFCQATADSAYSLTDFEDQPLLSNVELTVASGGHVTGTVTQRPQLSSLFDVFLVDPTTHRIVKSVQSAPSGDFQFDNLVTGDYFLAVFDYGYQEGSVVYPSTPCYFYREAVAPLPCDFSNALSVHVDAPGTLANVNVVMPVPDSIFLNGFE